MCGRYYIDKDTFQIIKQQLDEESDVECDQGDILPSQQIPILYQENKKIKMTKKTWGYTSSKYQGRIINAKCETIFERVMFQKDIYNNRCLIVAKGFYEWDSLKHRFRFENNQKALYFAGIYHGEEVVIITTKANNVIKSIHHRMPLIIQEQDIHNWLCDNEKAFTLLKSKTEDLEIIAGFYQQSLFDE